MDVNPRKLRGGPTAKTIRPENLRTGPPRVLCFRRPLIWYQRGCENEAAWAYFLPADGNPLCVQKRKNRDQYPCLCIKIGMQ